MKTEKIKGFVENHKKELAITAMIGGGVLCGVVGFKICDLVKIGDGRVVDNQRIIEVFTDAKAKGLLPGPIFTGIADEPFKPEDLGELGEVMTETAGAAKVAFTHFIAIGKEME